MKAALKVRAYEEAAAVLETEMSAIDLPEDLTEKEEEEMREFIRNHIVGHLRATAVTLAQRIRSRK